MSGQTRSERARRQLEAMRAAFSPAGSARVRIEVELSSAIVRWLDRKAGAEGLSRSAIVEDMLDYEMGFAAYMAQQAREHPEELDLEERDYWAREAGLLP